MAGTTGLPLSTLPPCHTYAGPQWSGPLCTSCQLLQSAFPHPHPSTLLQPPTSTLTWVRVALDRLHLLVRQLLEPTFPIPSARAATAHPGAEHPAGYGGGSTGGSTVWVVHRLTVRSISGGRQYNVGNIRQYRGGSHTQASGGASATCSKIPNPSRPQPAAACINPQLNASTRSRRTAEIGPE